MHGTVGKEKEKGGQGQTTTDSLSLSSTRKRGKKDTKGWEKGDVPEGAKDGGLKRCRKKKNEIAGGGKKCEDWGLLKKKI